MIAFVYFLDFLGAIIALTGFFCALMAMLEFSSINPVLCITTIVIGLIIMWIAQVDIKETAIENKLQIQRIIVEEIKNEV